MNAAASAFSRTRSSQAERFLRAIAGNSLLTLQTFDDTSARRSALARVIQGWGATTETQLHALNARGAGVFFMVNQGDGTGRRTSNVKCVRSLFVDLDGASLQPVMEAPLKPHIAVQSSPGRFHAYWLVDGVALTEFQNFQHQLAERFSGDPSVSDLPRVMRVPGFLHQKKTPYLSNIIYINTGLFDRSTFVRAFELDRRPTVVPLRTSLGGKVMAGNRNAELFSRARGFVNKGLLPDQVNHRLQAFNAKNCEPPLCASEVDEIASRASAQPAKGRFELPFALCDSPKFRGLTDAQFRIAVNAYRRGSNGAEFGLPWSDLKDIFPHDQRFYNARKALEAMGLIELVRESKNTQLGRTTRVFRLQHL